MDLDDVADPYRQVEQIYDTSSPHPYLLDLVCARHDPVHHSSPAVDRSERRAQNRACYAWAYRYWLQHDAPSRWHPWRWILASQSPYAGA